jgi:transposase
MDFVGIDLHKTSSQICTLTEGGGLAERRIKTTRAAFDEVSAGRPRARVLVEASTESEWVAQHLESLGHEVIVADPNFAPMYATRVKRIKTDKRDSRALCEACRLGAYRHAHRTSERQRRIRAQLLVRTTLVRTRSKYISLVGALARREGCRIATGGSENFAARVEAAGLPAQVMAAIASLLESLKVLNRQISEADAELEKIVREDAVVRRLCTAPRSRAGDGNDLRRHHRRRGQVRGGQAGQVVPRAGPARVQLGRAAAPRADQQGREQPGEDLTRGGGLGVAAARREERGALRLGDADRRQARQGEGLHRISAEAGRQVVLQKIFWPQFVVARYITPPQYLV